MAARLPGVTAAAIVAAVVVVVTVIWDEPDAGDGAAIWFVTGSLALGAALSLAGTFPRDPWWRRVLFGFAGAIVGVMSWLGALSFGPLLIPAVLLLVFAFARG